MDGSQQGIPERSAPQGVSQQGTPAAVNPAGAGQFKALSGAATAATVLISLAVVRDAVVTAGNWRLYLVVHDYLAGRVTAAEVEATDTDTLATLASWPSFLIWLAAGVVFIVWLRRARLNAELTSGAAAHRRSRSWVVGGWVAPVANLWVPYQVVSDIWRAGAPRRSAPVTLVTAWWVLFAAATFIVKPIQWRMAAQFADEQDVLTNAYLSTLLTGLYLAAGLLVVLIIRRITAWQTQGHVRNTG
ncbi:DUF4328 domain-containing protein [Streptomyces sp. NPDC052496]|uniref:DUF4328 domain-containing protein n=1 Tax=Streptomyces sp. NPDC052496 TaxID=3154951 RepID=UPI0034206BD6